MAEFKDVNGKTWTVSIDAPTIQTIRKECDLDLANLDGTAYERMADDPCLLVDVLWYVCREQADQAEITDIQFGRALKGDAIEHATAAMLAGIADFFPKRKFAILKRITDLNRRVRTKGMEAAIKRLDDPALEAKAIAAMESQMDAEILTALTRLSSATSTPASVASGPTDSPSAS